MDKIFYSWCFRQKRILVSLFLFLLSCAVVLVFISIIGPKAIALEKPSIPVIKDREYKQGQEGQQAQAIQDDLVPQAEDAQNATSIQGQADQNAASGEASAPIAKRQIKHDIFPIAPSLRPFEGQGPYRPAGPNPASADEDYILGLSKPEAESQLYYGPSTRASIAFVIDASGKEYFTRHIDDISPMASLTKMMALLYALEKGLSLDTSCTISEYATKVTGNKMGWTAGTTVPLSELMQAMIIHSGNDAAIALAEAVSGSEQAFCMEMGKRAQELGCTSSQFVTPHGLDRTGHYSSGRDLYIIARELMKYPFFRENAKKPIMDFNINGEIKRFNNTNSLVAQDAGFKGVKTGFTLQAGYSLLSYYEQDDIAAYILVMGTKSNESRNQETLKLLNWLKTFYSKQYLVRSDKPFAYFEANPLRFGYLRALRAEKNLIYYRDPHKEKAAYSLFAHQEKHGFLGSESKAGEVFLSKQSNQRQNFEQKTINLVGDKSIVRWSSLKPRQLNSVYYLASGRFRAVGVINPYQL